jgi:hypothetical protein
MKKVGNIKKRFLTKEVINEGIDYLTRGQKRSHWTPAMRKSWTKILTRREAVVNSIFVKLTTRTYKFSDFKIFHRYENKKKRKIYASAPEDQIVDYVLDQCLKYAFTVKKRILHQNSYGSIKNKGQHELRKRVMEAVKGKDEVYVAICDTYHYYPTINHQILMSILERHIKDKWVLWLCKITIERNKEGEGIALGLASSNILGHIYHSEVDWVITHGEDAFKRYYRFCDDKIFIGPDKNYLHTLVRNMRNLVEQDLKQKLKPSWRVVNVNTNRFEFLGALIGKKNAILSSYKRRRIERKFKKEEKLPFHNTPKDYDRVMRTWAGIKGGFKNLEVRNLIRWWVLDSPFQEFFNRLKRVYEYKSLI